MTEVRDRLRAASEGQVPPGDPLERLERRRGRRRRRERATAAVFAMVLTAGVLGGSLYALHRAGQGRETRRAGAFGVSDTPVLGDGQYLYVRWTNVDPGVGFVQQTWWATDGSGRVEAACTDAGCEQHYGFPPTGTFEAGGFPIDADLTGLSTDPTTLREQLLQRTAPGGASPEPAVSPGPDLAPGVTEGGLLYAIDNLLQDPNGTPELKAAVFEVARGLDSVTERTGTDPSGRAAVELDIAYGSPPAPRSYFFDPSTHLLTAIRTTEDAYQLYDQGIVDSTDATPAGDQWLFPEAPRR